MASERKRVLDKDYADDFTSVTVKLLETGETATIDVASLSDEIRAQAICHGLLQKIGDAAAGKSGDEAAEAVLAVVERLRAGDWTIKGEAGPRPTLVAEAVMAVCDADGVAYDRAAVIAKYTGKDGEPARKKALANPAVRAAYEAKRAEAAVARAAKMAEKAKGATGGTSADLV
jgi:hypothetical protein